MENKSEAGNQGAYLIATGASVRIIDNTQPQVITIHAVGDPNSKRRGEATEAEFIARAAGLDFRIAKPWGDSDSYDVLVGMGRGFWRVQVKRTSSYRDHIYQVKGRGSAGPYSKDDIDFLAAHIVPENVWYIVPVEAFSGVSALHFNPRIRSRGQYEKYREAWCLLAGGPKTRGWKDIPVLCRCKDLPVRCAVCPHRK
jgi:hypothetical protein